ncbi:MAG: hypothetical protein R6U27_10575 [Desulfobacterales bacterium]
MLHLKINFQQVVNLGIQIFQILIEWFLVAVIKIIRTPESLEKIGAAGTKKRMDENRGFGIRGHV